ncbi:MAG: integrase [Bryobacteraceae bacterium]
MLKVVNPVDEITAARLVELLDPSTPWNRSLWSLGTVLTLREILEASEANRTGILSDESIKRLGQACMRLLGKDPGVPDGEKNVLNEALRTSPRYDGLSYHTISQLAESIDANYLTRWAAFFAGNVPSQPERSARSIAAYLTDHGFSEEFLHTWWTKWLYKDPTELTLPQVCELAHRELASLQPLDYEILVAFKNAPRSASGFPIRWKTAEDVSRWLRSNHFDVENVRVSGGFIMTIRAKDSRAAVQRAADRMDHILARSSVATARPLEAWPAIWVKGERSCFAFGPRARGVRVKALYREDQIFAESDSNVDAAIDLLAHLENSSPSAAIAGGWAAMEALLAEPNDRAGAAESLASLVACSFPRAELTVLSYTAERLCPDLPLKDCTENRDRALVLGKAIIAGHTLNLRKHTDQAALRRMTKVLQAPSHCLSDVQTYVADTFQRLYRQRNLILHGGKTNSVALRGSLRTAAKLVGAGMDRITHGWYVKGVRPLEVAARAKSALRLVPNADPQACVDLLGI